MKRLHQLNETFFDKIDTQEKAYCLGFLFADGCNILHRNRISIGLHEKDLDILKNINDLFFDHNCIIISRDISSHYVNDRLCKSSGRAIRLCINSKYLSSKLNDLGMVPRKSSILQFPKCVPDNFISHFVRGYFDGDGSLIRYKSKRGFSIKIASSNDFCDRLKEVVKCHVGISGIVSKESEFYSCFLIGGMYNSKMFCEWMYKNAIIKSSRKFKTYLDLCERVKTLHRAKYKYIYPNKKISGTWIADVYLGNKKMKRLGDRFPTEQVAYDFQQQWKLSSGILNEEC